MASTKKAAPAATKKAPVKAAKKAPATKVAKKVAAKAAKPAFTPRKGETLNFTRRNGSAGSGKYQETADYGRGPWYILKVEGMRKPTASVRPSEVWRPEKPKAAPAPAAA